MLWRYMQLGGPLMWPLLGCSVLLGAILFERMWTVVILHRMLGVTAPSDRLAWHRRILPFFTDIPPSLGLLGTVIGVGNSFGALGGKLNTEALGAGLGIAILTTIYGLSIAIVAATSSYALDWVGGLRVVTENVKR